MKYNKAISFMYKKLYNNGQFTKLIITSKEIKTLNTYYKNNFNKYEKYENFYDSLGELKDILNLSKAAVLEFKKQFENKKGLQPAVITECYIAQTIANMLNLGNFVDIDEKEDNMPSSLAMTLLRSRGDSDKALPRYIYHNDKNDVILVQYGDSSSVDAIFVKSKTKARIEFKEQKSKLTEPDIHGLYSEDGKLIIDDHFKERYSEYIPMIDIFNDKTSVFDSIGHNFNLSEFISNDILQTMVEKVFTTKNINLYILQQGNKIYPVLSGDLLKNIDTSGSEIRTAGRNSKKFFTRVYAYNTISNLGGIISADEFKVPCCKIGNTENGKKFGTVGRNTNKITRYKINNLLFVRAKDAKIKDDFLVFPVDKLMQLIPTISVHLNVKIDEEVLKSAYNLIAPTSNSKW